MNEGRGNGRRQRRERASDDHDGRRSKERFFLRDAIGLGRGGSRAGERDGDDAHRGLDGEGRAGGRDRLGGADNL